MHGLYLSYPVSRTTCNNALIGAPTFSLQCFPRLFLMPAAATMLTKQMLLNRLLQIVVDEVGWEMRVRARFVYRARRSWRSSLRRARLLNGCVYNPACFELLE